MLFEDLLLRPNSGTIDVGEVAAWLDARPHVFRDPVGDDGWHMSRDASWAAMRRRARVENAPRWPNGVRIGVSADQVWLAARAGPEELARALQFVEWLARDGEWTVTVDRHAPQPLGDPRRLFPTDLPAPATLDDDLMLGLITEGIRVTWRDTNPADPRSLVIHSSGASRYERGARVLRGDLEPDHRAQWGRAIADVDLDEIELPDTPAGRTVRLEITDADGPELFNIDPDAPPTRCAPLVALARRLMAGLDAWTPGASIEGVASAGQ